MKIIELNKEQFIFLLSNPHPLSHGCNGIVTLINNKLYKIYYKDFFEFYLSKNEEELEKIVKGWLEIELITNCGLKNPQVRMKDYEKLNDTKSKGLITAILSYKGLFVGIEMKYYKDFLEFDTALKYLNDNDISKCINKAFYLVNDLLNNNIVARDIKESNILVNPKTLEVVLIDLDGTETTYGPNNYIKDYPYNQKMVMRSFKEMVERLEKQKVKKL